MADLFNVPGSNDTVEWAAEPATRGTFTLLSTCIITLTLCVWSSVHLNLLGNDRSFGAKFLRRLRWIASALLIPELLILTAWSQRKMAKRILKRAEDTFKSKQKASDADRERQLLSRRHTWTMTHSFWAIMGGISIDSNDSEPFIPNSQRCTLTPNGVLLLLKHEPQLVPDISEEEIKDKSKGSSLTKLVACIQATWFCLSCIARVAHKLPLSMLELNTFAHAFCTLIVYVLWWRKPLDIEQPVLVQEDRIGPLLAYMWMASKTSCLPKPKSSGDTTTTVGRDPEFEAIVDERMSARTADTSSQVWNTIQSVSRSVVQSVHDPSTGALDETSPLTFKVTTSQDLPGTGFKANGKSSRWKVVETTSHGNDEFAKVYSHVHYNPAVFNLTPRDVRRWRLAREAMNRYGVRKPDKDLDLVTVKPIAEHMDQSNDPDETSATWPLLGFSSVAAVYGGLHALAWDAPFPSYREMVLWRVSALLIASPAVFGVLMLLLYYSARAAAFVLRSSCLKLVPAAKPRQTQHPEPLAVKEETSLESTAHAKKIKISILRSLGDVILYLASAAFCFLYFPARGYLLYESFRTVFFLPPEAYKATLWTQYLPHIT